MQEVKFTIRYLPKFEEDLNGIIDYIVFSLHNPDSAAKLVDKIENTVLERSNFPLSFEKYASNRPRKNAYYRIYVDNFTVFYVVIDNVMEVRRILYKGRDMGKIIK